MFQLVSSRESSKPENNWEPSAAEEDTTNEEIYDHKTKKFVPSTPTRKRKEVIFYHVQLSFTKVIEAFNANDPTKEIPHFMAEENEPARHHEMEIFKLLLNGSSGFQSAHCTPALGCPPQTYLFTQSNIGSRSDINFLGSADPVHAHDGTPDLNATSSIELLNANMCNERQEKF